MNYVDFTEQPARILSLCPGMRGLERGFDRACERLGWKPHRTTAYVEIEAFIIYNLVKQMEQGVLEPAPIHSNIKTFDGKPFRGKIHGIFGGYPCQPFSLAGERKGTEDPRHLWPYISGIIESIRPVFCFFENVAGHLTMGFPEVYRGLRDLGYRVEAGIFTAEEVGAPHQRERLFILAVENSHRESVRNNFGGIYREVARAGNVENAMRSGPRSECREIGGGIGKQALRQGDGQERAIRTEPASELADTNKPGRAQPFCRELRSIQQTKGTSEGCKLSGVLTAPDRWPAGPGQPQHEWEAPRVESRLGFTVNGYNYREDLLRMAGNGVVEQTAELAFLTLLEKHRTDK
jgi:DNA (cytosine-5)-methyltransferase 1